MTNNLNKPITVDNKVIEVGTIYYRSINSTVSRYNFKNICAPVVQPLLCIKVSTGRGAKQEAVFRNPSRCLVTMSSGTQGGCPSLQVFSSETKAVQHAADVLRKSITSGLVSELGDVVEEKKEELRAATLGLANIRKLRTKDHSLALVKRPDPKDTKTLIEIYNNATQ